MNAIARVGKSRDLWKLKASERATENRYLRRQLGLARSEAKKLRARVRTLEADREPLPPVPVTAPQSIAIADAAAVRTLSVLLVIQAVVSFRSVPRILELTRPGSWVPHFTSVINWTLRVGLAMLQGVEPTSSPWIAIVDTSIDVGLSKLLVVLRVPLSALARRGSAVTLADCEVVGIKIRSTWDGESVEVALKESFAKAGNPAAILKDQGTDLAKGVKLWRGNADLRSVKVIDDVGHIAANALKREFADTPGFKSFLAYVKAAAGKLWQSDVAFLAPPRPRTKGRFMSITRLARWAERLRPLLGGRGRVEEATIAGRLRQLAGGLGPHQVFLERFTLACEVVERCLETLKNKGMNQATFREVVAELERLPDGSHVKGRLTKWARKQLNNQARLGIGQMPLLVSSDIIESLFGKLKVVLSRNPKAEFNRIALTVPCLCGTLTEGTVGQALRTVTHRDLERWEKEYVPPTQKQARAAFNRGELTSTTVPKTAQTG
jgi:hypothetical protein